MHGGEGWEDEKTGNQEGAEKAHAEDNDDGADDGKNSAVKIGFDADGAGELFVEGDGKNTIEGEEIEENTNDGDDEAENDFLSGDGEDAAEEETCEVDVDASGEGGSESADGEAAGGKNGDPSIAAEFAVCA